MKCTSKTVLKTLPMLSLQPVAQSDVTLGKKLYVVDLLQQL
jgi:hypothetical protein